MDTTLLHPCLFVFASCWYLCVLFPICLQHHLNSGSGFCVFIFQGEWREHKLSPNWRNQFSFLKSDRLSLIAYWLHREIIIMLLLSVKKTITKDNALNQERYQISSSPEQPSLPELQVGSLQKDHLLPGQLRQSARVKGVWIFLGTSPKSMEKMSKWAQAFSRHLPSSSCQPEQPCPHHSHRMFGCHPRRQQSLEQDTEFIQTPLASADGHPAFSGLSQALNRPCWNLLTQWISSCITRVCPSPDPLWNRIQ